MAANRHPDHDTICKFRRENEKAVREAFLQVLLLAREVRLLRVGLVSVDGTQIDANASRHRNVRYDRAGELVDQLRGEISQLLERAERANGEGVSGSAGSPTELSRREVLRERLEAARARLQARAQEQAERERPAYEAKVAARAKRAGRRRGPVPKAPSGTPRDKELSNLTDPDSGLMRRSRSHESRQCYNAQAAVAAEGSQLVLGARIARNASDRNELVASVDAIPSALQLPETVLADNGYANGEEVAVLQGRGVEVLVATCAEGDRRQHDFRPEPAPRAARTMRSAWMLALRARREQPELRAKYRLTDRGAGVRCAQTGDGVHAFPAAGVRRGRDRVATCNVGLQLPANPPIAGLGPSIETEKDNQRPRPCHPRTIDRRTYQPGRRDDARIRPTEHERLYSETAKSDRLLRRGRVGSGYSL